MNGTVLAYSLYIRDNPNPNANALGGLSRDDKVTADFKTNGWWHLTSIMRAGVSIPLPGAENYSYEGATNGFIHLDPEGGSGGKKTVEIGVDDVLVQSAEVDVLTANGLLAGTQTINYQYP